MTAKAPPVIKPPLTLAAAEKMKYGALLYREGYCAYPVRIRGRGQTYSQCTHKPGYGPARLYGKRHGEMVDDAILSEPDYKDLGEHT